MMIGRGSYQLSEVSRYTELPPSTVRSWFNWRSDRAGLGPLFRSDFESVDRDYAVSFLNLIEAYVAAFFRSQGVKPPIIRRAYLHLQCELASEHPFARSDLYTDGRAVIRRAGDEVNAPELTDVVTKQRLFDQWREYLSRIEYVEATRLAGRWNIADGVVIDPLVCFGKPVVRSTGVTTFVLANQYRANNRNAALVADLYGVSEQDVLNAARFETEHRRSRAA